MIKERLGVVDEDMDDDSGIEGENNENYEDDGEKIDNKSKEDNDDDDDDDDDDEGHQHQKSHSNRKKVENSNWGDNELSRHDQCYCWWRK
jgi:hypothetical protein